MCCFRSPGEFDCRFAGSAPSTPSVYRSSTPSVHWAIQQLALGGLDMNWAGVGRVLDARVFPAIRGRAQSKLQGARKAGHQARHPRPCCPNQTTPLQTSTRVFDCSSHDRNNNNLRRYCIFLQGSKIFYIGGLIFYVISTGTNMQQSVGARGLKPLQTCTTQPKHRAI